MTCVGEWGFEGDAAPQFYRKIGLNGRCLFDSEPYLHKRTDTEQETTCVDALTLELRHQTSDVYVPLVDSDFSLEVRRNSFSSVWSSSGLTASQRPDLPFGNGWSSGVAPHIHIIDRGTDQPVYVIVADEQGTRHRFVEFFKDARHAGYYPLPGSDYEQDSRAMVLVRRENQFEFRRKYGTALFFESTSPTVEISNPKENHLYYRAIRTQDRRGGYLLYHFEAKNKTLIPNEISFADRRLTIHCNEQGVIDKIIDLRGSVHRYEYRPSKIPHGAPLLIHSFRPKVREKEALTIYDYDEVSHPTGSDTTEQHSALSVITDPRGNTYRLQYSHHFPKEQNPSAAAHPIQVKEVLLPNGAISKFFDYSPSTESFPNKSKRMIFVSDAERNGRLYEFTDPERITFEKWPFKRSAASSPENIASPRYTAWRKQFVTYYNRDGHDFDAAQCRFRAHFLTRKLLKECYEFDVGAGMALSRAIDAEGHVTAFTYGDPLVRPELVNLPETFADPFSQRCMDVTETKNPLGGIKRFSYHPTNRAILRKEDEIGHRTVFTVHERTGLPLSETVYASADDEKSGKSFARKEYEYENPTFPGFQTKKVICKTGFYPENPSWEVDLIRAYEADEYGNSVRESADPNGHKYVWLNRYDEHNSKTSVLYPDGYYVQFRYDPCNRLDRVYKSHGSVKKNYYDIRGNKIREIESNGDITIFIYDSHNCVIQKTVETGPVDKRVRKESLYKYNRVGSKIYEAEYGNPIRKLKHDGLQRLVYLKKGMQSPIYYSYSANGSCNLFKSSLLASTRHHGLNVGAWHCVYDERQNRIRQYRVIDFILFDLPLPVEKYANRYDLAGNLLEEKDGLAVTRYEYDALNRRTVTHYPNGRWTRILRTSTGLEYGTLDSAGNRTEKRFDGVGEEIPT